MGKKSRTKGKAFELEVARLLWNMLGVRVQRNLEQYQTNGLGDLVGWDGVCIECKRRSKVTPGMIEDWWRETKSEAGDNKPLLVYREDRKNAVFCMDSADIGADVSVMIYMDADSFRILAHRYLFPED